MNKPLIISINLGCFLTAFIYGFSFILPTYMNTLGGNDFDVGIFLTVSGVSTVSIVLFNGFILRYLTPLSLTILSVLFLAIGLALLGITYHFGPLLYIIALFIGFGWGGFYLSGPMALSNSLQKNCRAIYFSYMTAWNTLGAGLSPIIFNQLSFIGLTAHNAFQLTIIPSIIAILSFIFAKRHETVTNNESIKPQKGLAMIFNRDLFQSIAMYPIFMVLIGACLFSGMMNFQVTYAKINHVNYAWYFFSYTLVVIFSRFFLSKKIAALPNYITLPLLTSLMIIAMIAFAFIQSNLTLYIMSALLFGIGYGLIYPLIKAITVNVVTARLHNTALSYFTLSYFIGIYLFPFFNGFILAYLPYKAIVFLLISLTILYQIVVFIFLRLFKSSN